jgi:hypothetical protein
MKKTFFVFLLSALTSLPSAEKVLTLTIGPSWPQALLNTEKPTAGNASIRYGALFDRKVSIGAGIDFLWNNNAKETETSNNLYQIEVMQRTLMFPLSGFISITPLPDLLVQPGISSQFGLNTMYFSYQKDSTVLINNQRSNIDGNGWYMGFYWKIAADAICKLGENSAILAGVDFQYSKPKKLLENNSNMYVRRNMNGIGIHGGFQFTY